MSMNNPFFHRGAIRQSDDFYGREAELNQMIGLLRNGQSVSLIGPRRIGKSSLLMHLCRPQVRASLNLDPTATLFVLLDCQEFGESPADEIYDLFWQSVCRTAEEAGVSLGGTFKENQPSDGGGYRELDRALYQLSQKEIGVVVLLDEFELLAANRLLTPYFFARLRGLTTKYGLAYLTASQRPLFAITAEEEVLSSPFFNIFVTLALGLFTPGEAQSLLDGRLQKAGLVFSPHLKQRLIALGGAHPFFLHIAGYHAVQAIAQGADLEQAAEWALVEAAIEVEAHSHLSYLWQNLSADEQYALVLADGPVDSVRQLEQNCLLQWDDGRYTYTSQLLQNFVRRQNVAGLIQAGPFIIDQYRHQVWANGKEMALTNSQFSILVRLCQQAGQVVHGEDLETAVWGDVLVEDPDRLKTLIKRLRRAIEPYSTWIVSERGVGYTLRSPD